MARIPAAMHDGDYYDHAGFDSIINAKWKAMNQGAPRVSMNDLIAQWRLRNDGKGCENLIKKLVTQP